LHYFLFKCWRDNIIFSMVKLNPWIHIQISYFIATWGPGLAVPWVLPRQIPHLCLLLKNCHSCSKYLAFQNSSEKNFVDYNSQHYLQNTDFSKRTKILGLCTSITLGHVCINYHYLLQCFSFSCSFATNQSFS
jgi:hypothetical protein